MAEVIERLSSIETTLVTIQNTLAAQNGWNEKTAQERTQHYTQTIKQLAVIESVQGDMKASAQQYQNDCTEQREEHEKKLQDHDLILARIETKSSLKSTIISTVISLAGVAGAWAALWQAHKP